MSPDELPYGAIETVRHVFEVVIMRLRGAEAMSRLELDHTPDDEWEKGYMVGVADTFDALAKGMQEELDRFNQLTA